jgi:hypothetical protein
LVVADDAVAEGGVVPVLPPALLPPPRLGDAEETEPRLGDAVDTEVEDVERFLEMEEIRFCNDVGVVFRLSIELDADAD